MQEVVEEGSEPVESFQNEGFQEILRTECEAAKELRLSKTGRVGQCGATEPSGTGRRTRLGLTLVRGSSLSLVDLPTFLPTSVTLGRLSTISGLVAPPARPLPRHKGRSGSRSQWTVMCVALGFFSSCLILVGGMLSITSEYQDRAIARMLNISTETQP